MTSETCNKGDHSDLNNMGSEPPQDQQQRQGSLEDRPLLGHPNGEEVHPEPNMSKFPNYAPILLFLLCFAKFVKFLIFLLHIKHLRIYV